MNEKFKEALDQSMADVTWKEKNRQRVLYAARQETRPASIRKGVLIPVIALLLLCLAMAVAGATSETVNGWLYQQWPRLATLLMPVNMSCEDQGIRMEVISAVAEGNEVLINYSMQDLEGNRIDENSSAYFDMIYAGTNNYNGGGYDSVYDPEEKKLYASTCLNTETAIDPQDRNVILYTDLLENARKTTVDLLPLLKQYGNQAEAVPVPENAVACTGYQDGEFWSVWGDIDSTWTIPDSLRVLDQSRSPEIRLSDHVFLSGIGMVDGLMHIQLHITVPKEVSIPGTAENGWKTVEYVPCSAWIELYDTETGFDADDQNRRQDKLPGGISTLYWEAEGAGGERWEEIILTPDSEPEETQTFTAEIIEASVPISGDWRIKIPMRTIQHRN